MKQSLDEKMREARERLERQSAEIEAMTSAELKRLAKSLTSECERELKKIRSDIQEHGQMTASLAELLRWPRWTAAICVTIVGISLALLWAGTWWMSGNVWELRSQVEAETQALAQLQAQTGGVRILQAPNGTFLVLPDSADQAKYTCDGKTCLKLSGK
ncbi:hypothetical protein ACVNHC_24250 [Pannonibacter sp. Q-1]